MEWLKAIRKNKGLSQAAVAAQISIAQATYCNIETGRRNPSNKVAKRIASILEFDWTLFYEDNKTVS